MMRMVRTGLLLIDGVVLITASKRLDGAATAD
jgi:hypothetical protein